MFSSGMERGHEDEHDLYASRRLHAEATARLLAAERHGEAQAQPPPGRDPGWLTTDGFWAILDEIPDEEGAVSDNPTGHTDGRGRYSFREVYSTEVEFGAVPAQSPQEGGRQGTLNASEVTGMIDVPRFSVVWMTWAEHLGGGGFRFKYSLAGTGTGGGGGGGGGPPFDPPCPPLPTYRYDCLPYPGGSGANEFMLAEFISRVTRDPVTGCYVLTAFEFSRFLPVCCDCAVTCAECPACDPVDGVDTACCDAVPCDLCLTLEGADGCERVQAVMTYVPDDPMSACVCGWASDPFYLGTCQLSASLVCLPADGAVPARWELRLRNEDPAADPAEWVVAMSTTDCGPPIALYGDIVMGGGDCCASAEDFVFVTARITPAPCDGGCVPETACVACPDGAPLGYSVDLTALAAADPAFADVTGAHTLLYTGGCEWRKVTAGGSLVRLWYYGFVAGFGHFWVLLITAPSGLKRGSEAFPFDCCAGGYAPMYGGTVTITPLPSTCCDVDAGGTCCGNLDFSVHNVTVSGALTGTGALTYNGLGRWTGNVLVDDGVSCTAEVHVELFCDPTTGWQIQLSGCDGQTVLADTVVCDPPGPWSFEAAFTLNAACCGGGAVTFTITV